MLTSPFDCGRVPATSHGNRLLSNYRAQGQTDRGKHKLSMLRVPAPGSRHVRSPLQFGRVARVTIVPDAGPVSVAMKKSPLVADWRSPLVAS